MCKQFAMLEQNTQETVAACGNGIGFGNNSSSSSRTCTSTNTNSSSNGASTSQGIARRDPQGSLGNSPQGSSWALGGSSGDSSTTANDSAGAGPSAGTNARVLVH